MLSLFSVNAVNLTEVISMKCVLLKCEICRNWFSPYRFHCDVCGNAKLLRPIHKCSHVNVTNARLSFSAIPTFPPGLARLLARALES